MSEAGLVGIFSLLDSSTCCCDLFVATTEESPIVAEGAVGASSEQTSSRQHESSLDLTSRQPAPGGSTYVWHLFLQALMATEAASSERTHSQANSQSSFHFWPTE